MSDQPLLSSTVLSLLVVTLLAGCDKTPVRVESTNNTEVKLATMFTHDGCTVYRFMDFGNPHYFADCRGSVTSRQSCGKGCVRNDEVPTNE